MPQVSIVVPYRGDTKLFERTLISVLQNRPADCEIIVPQFNYQDPYELRDEVEFVEVDRKANISRQLDAAIQVSNSDVIHWLNPGVEVTEGWCGWSVAHFHDPYVGSVVPLIVNEDGRTITAGLKPDFFLRKRNLGSGSINPQKLKMLNPTGPTSSAGFYRKSALLQIPAISDLGAATLDLEIAMALGEIGFDCKLEVDSLIKLEKRQQEAIGAIGSGIDMQNTIWRFAADGLMQSLLVSTGVSLFELSTAIFQPENILRIFGRMIALKDLVRCKHFHQVLELATGPELTGQKRRIIGLEQQGVTTEADSGDSSRRAA